MKRNPKFQNLLWGALAVAVLAVCGWSFLTGNPEHIEDTNGPDNYALTTITDENIVNMDVGALGGPIKSKDIIGGDVFAFSAEEFTGVYEILYDNFIGPSDFDLNLTNYEITGGNFRLVVVHNDEIVAELEPVCSWITDWRM